MTTTANTPAGQDRLEFLAELTQDEPTVCTPGTPKPVASGVHGADECELDHDAAAPAAARHFAHILLASQDMPEETIDSVLLVTSELVTNAVEHALPPLTLHVRPDGMGGRVWIGVTDGGPAPQEGPWTASCTREEHGRGRVIVEMLAETHGSHTHSDGHTTHWARITTS
ncbi:ATP-binding protein [Streptomyces cinereoruber]|uniref:ATP-binding protein n=1 Tax=Streptomyces cinereoruber TaxID=67260 RepID=UPI0036298B5F